VFLCQKSSPANKRLDLKFQKRSMCHSWAKELSKALSPFSSKFFFWLTLLGRCWTSECLQGRHSLPNSGPCALCSQADETLQHLLLLGCSFSREVWVILLHRVGFQFLTPVAESKVPDWWLLSRKRVPKDCRRGFDTVAPGPHDTHDMVAMATVIPLTSIRYNPKVG
jgi:hypothetical protein